jgi:OmpR family response regulator RpaB
LLLAEIAAPSSEGADQRGIEMTNESIQPLKVLIADDEDNIRRVLETRLKLLGYAVAVAENGVKAMELFHAFQPNLAVLDVMMPELDGFGVTEQIRAQSEIPIILLTALSDVANRITGLQLGADDYMVKPFSPKELEARIRSVMRRVDHASGHRSGSPGHSGVLQVGDLLIDFNRRAVFRGEARVRLTGMEFSMLELLVRRAGEVISRLELLEAVWGYRPERASDTRVVDVHVSRLRAKLEDDADQPSLILTARGTGYMFARQSAPKASQGGFT